MTAPAAETAAAATTAPSLALAQATRAVQLTIRARLLKDVATLWPLLDAKRLDQTFPGWLRAMLGLTTKYHSESALAAAAYYQAARQLRTGAPPPAGLIKLAPSPDEQWMTRAYGYSGPGLLLDRNAKPGTALSTTLGTSARIVADGGRITTVDTASADPQAVGYYRVTDGHPCAFCALLASRGIAYLTEKSAGFKSHNDCGCSAGVAFSRDQQLPDISAKADRVYREATKGVRSGQQLAAFRKAWAESAQ